MIIDLRSDTVTKPSNDMLEAMTQAKVGDDVYKEDETVNALEAHLARMFGKPKALFFPTGTMANQTAIKLHTQPGDQVILYQGIFLPSSLLQEQWRHNHRHRSNQQIPG